MFRMKRTTQKRWRLQSTIQSSEIAASSFPQSVADQVLASATETAILQHCPTIINLVQNTN